MPNQYKNKVVYNGTTLIDLTADTVTADSLIFGVTAHGADGAPITGTIANGDPLGYGRNTNARVGACKADSAIITDPVSDISGKALVGLATLGS